MCQVSRPNTGFILTETVPNSGLLARPRCPCKRTDSACTQPRANAGASGTDRISMWPVVGGRGKPWLQVRHGEIWELGFSEAPGFLGIRGSARRNAWSPIGPHEADAQLVVDADGVLSSPVAAEFLEADSRRKPEVSEGCSGVHRRQHGACALHQMGREALAVAVPQGIRREPAPGACDHDQLCIIA